MTDTPDGTAAGLLSFLDWTIERNELVPVTASSYRTAARRVLETEGDPALIDLRKLDVDELLRRFANRTRGDFKEQSLATYEQRFRNALAMYLTYLEGGDWRPAKRASRSSDKRRPTPVKGPQRAASSGSNDEGSPAARPTRAHGAPAMITFPLPIRAGVRGQLVVPEDLTAQEAQRISQVVAALAIGTDDRTGDAMVNSG